MQNKPQMLMLDGTDQILKHWQHGTHALVIDRKEISSKINESPWPNDIPVSFRSMTKRKEIYKCWETGRPFYYVDNGYMGNLMKKKIWYRIVKNNVQHTIPFFIDFSRFWNPLGPQVGPMLRPCWPPNPPKSDFEDNTKKHKKNQMPGSILEIQIWGSWGPLN